jgi:hypothetical protein
VHDVHAALDQPVREADLVPGNPVAPVRSPVDGGDDDVTPVLLHPVDDPVGRGVGEFGHAPDARPLPAHRPARGDAAGRSPERVDHHAAAFREWDDGRPSGLGLVVSGSHRTQPRPDQHLERVLQTPVTDVQDVVVESDSTDRHPTLEHGSNRASIARRR